MSAQEWFNRLSEVFQLCEDRDISARDLEAEVNDLIVGNPQLNVVTQLTSLHLDWDELLVLLVIINRLVQYTDNHIIQSDLERMFPKRWMCRAQCVDLEDGSHPLMKLGIVEHCCSDGQVESDAWKLTDKAKTQLLSEIKIRTKKATPTSLKKCTDITSKQLYYNDLVTRQVSQLEHLLDETTFHAAQDRLEKHGMRRGFTCIFYGSPMYMSSSQMVLCCGRWRAKVRSSSRY